MKKIIKKMLTITVAVVTFVVMTPEVFAKQSTDSVEYAGYHFDLTVIANSNHFSASLSSYPNPGPDLFGATTGIEVFALNSEGKIVNQRVAAGELTCSTGTDISVPYEYATAYYLFNQVIFAKLTAYV